MGEHALRPLVVEVFHGFACKQNKAVTWWTDERTLIKVLNHTQTTPCNLFPELSLLELELRLVLTQTT